MNAPTANQSLFLAAAALAGAVAVILGALGSHALGDRLDDDLLRVYHIAVDYQFWHALALLATGLWLQWRPHPALKLAGWAFLFGLIAFCGSLYVLAFSGIHLFGAITPIGGLAFIIGWLAMFRAALIVRKTVD